MHEFLLRIGVIISLLPYLFLYREPTVGNKDLTPNDRGYIRYFAWPKNVSYPTFLHESHFLNIAVELRYSLILP